MIKLFRNTIDVIGNAVALGLHDLAEIARDGGGPVIRDDHGVPVAWRLFRFGPFSITRNGQTFQGEFSEAAADTVLAHFERKGGKIPLDSKHFLYLLAQEMGVSEAEVANLLPDGRGTFGYAALEKRADGLWVADVEYVPLAYRLMAEGIFRYFSPVIRGLSDGRLRITSVAFTNQPAIDQLDSLAATAEDPAVGSVDALAASLDAVASATRSSTKQKEPDMNKLLVLLAPLLALDSISLGDDGTVPEDVVDRISDLAGELEKLRGIEGGLKSFLDGVKDELALSGDLTLETARAAILGLSRKAGQAEALKSRVDALELEAEGEKRRKVIERGLAEGKLTKALVDGEWCRRQDAAALSAFLECAPVVVPSGSLDRGDLDPGDAAALSEDRRAILALVGVTDPEQQQAAIRG